VLFGQHCADEADQSVAVGEDADDVGAPPDLLVEPLPGVVGPDLAPDLFGERGERQQVRPGGFEVVGDLGELVGERVDDPIILRGNRFLVGLVEHRMQQGAYPRP
jgi:hypothetical protein